MQSLRGPLKGAPRRRRDCALRASIDGSHTATAADCDEEAMTAMAFFKNNGGPAYLDKPANRTWAGETATWLAGRAALDEADALAIELERKWGVGRLRLLVSPELRARFDSQRWKLTQAQWHGSLDDLVREAGRMARAWRALDVAAEAVGAEPLSPQVWELSLSDGRVVAITRSRAEAYHVADDRRFVATYTLDDIAELVEKHGPYFARSRKHDGEKVVPQAREIDDPLDPQGVSEMFLEDEIPF